MQKHFRAERAKFLQFALENTANLPFFVYLFQDPPKMDPPLNSHLRGGEKWTPPPELPQTAAAGECREQLGYSN